MNSAADARQNELLAALPPGVLNRWLPLLEAVDLPLGQVIFHPENRIDHVYFPTTAVVAMVYLTRDGELIDVAIVGREGMVGIAPLMGSASSPRSAVVQSAGRCLRMDARIAVAQFESGGAVMRMLGRYIQALMAQILQTAACNRFHSVDQQLCRWLLLALDRVHGNELAMTHELIAQILGVRREGVTKSAKKLQQSGAIRYARGHIVVLDRGLLEHQACECYSAVTREYARLLASPAIAAADLRAGAHVVSTLHAL